MKRVFFVRHGMTPGNEVNAYQKLDTPLSETGRKQAEFVADRFTRIPFDVLIASSMERAQETAHIIAARTGKEVITEHAFHEILKPSVVRGKLHTDETVLPIITEITEHWLNKDFKHSDEENFYELRDRATRALQYLIDRPEATLAVVTHGTILHMLITVMMSGPDVSNEIFQSLDRFMHMENTGITICEWDNAFRPKSWELITWNDHAHLG